MYVQDNNDNLKGKLSQAENMQQQRRRKKKLDLGKEEAWADVWGASYKSHLQRRWQEEEGWSERLINSRSDYIQVTLVSCTG